MVNDASRRSHDFKDELGGKPEWVGVYCERALKLHPSWKGLSGKAKVKTGIGKSDLPGLQGGPRKRDLCQLLHGARASALSRLAPAKLPIETLCENMSMLELLLSLRLPGTKSSVRRLSNRLVPRSLRQLVQERFPVGWDSS